MDLSELSMRALFWHKSSKLAETCRTSWHLSGRISFFCVCSTQGRVCSLVHPRSFCFRAQAVGVEVTGSFEKLLVACRWLSLRNQKVHCPHCTPHRIQTIQRRLFIFICLCVNMGFNLVTFIQYGNSMLIHTYICTHALGPSIILLYL